MAIYLPDGVYQVGKGWDASDTEAARESARNMIKEWEARGVILWPDDEPPLAVEKTEEA